MIDLEKPGGLYLAFPGLSLWLKPTKQGQKSSKPQTLATRAEPNPLVAQARHFRDPWSRRTTSGGAARGSAGGECDGAGGRAGVSGRGGVAEAVGTRWGAAALLAQAALFRLPGRLCAGPE